MRGTSLAPLLLGLAALHGAEALTIWRQETRRFAHSADYIAVEFLTDSLAISFVFLAQGSSVFFSPSSSPSSSQRGSN